MTLLIRSVETVDDIDICIAVAKKLSEGHILPLNFERAKRTMLEAARRKKFLKVGELNGQIRCWIYCQSMAHAHVAGSVFQQLYYASNLSGIDASNAIIEMHRAMLKAAKDGGFDLALAQGGCYGDDETIPLVLESDGWSRRGNVAVRKMEEVTWPDAEL